MLRGGWQAVESKAWGQAGEIQTQELWVTPG